MTYPSTYNFPNFRQLEPLDVLATPTRVILPTVVVSDKLHKLKVAARRRFIETCFQPPKTNFKIRLKIAFEFDEREIRKISSG